MSGQTIRDVVIRVAIESGNLRLGPLDTSDVDSSLDRLRAKIAGLGRTSVGPLSGLDTSSVEDSVDRLQKKTSQSASAIATAEEALNQLKAQSGDVANSRTVQKADRGEQESAKPIAISEAEKAVESLQKKMDSLRLHAPNTDGFKAAIQEIQEAINKADESLKRLQETARAQFNDSTFSPDRRVPREDIAAKINPVGDIRTVGQEPKLGMINNASTVAAMNDAMRSQNAALEELTRQESQCASALEKTTAAADKLANAAGSQSSDSSHEGQYFRSRLDRLQAEIDMMNSRPASSGSSSSGRSRKSSSDEPYYRSHLDRLQAEIDMMNNRSSAGSAVDSGNLNTVRSEAAATYDLISLMKARSAAKEGLIGQEVRHADAIARLMGMPSGGRGNSGGGFGNYVDVVSWRSNNGATSVPALGYAGGGGGGVGSGGMASAGSGAGVSQAAATGTSVLTGSLILLASSLLASKQASDEARKYNELYWRQLTDDAVAAQTRLTSGALRHYGQQEDLTMSQRNLGQIDRFLPNFERRETLEKDIRDFEASGARSDFKSRYRSQSLQRTGLEENRVALDSDRDFKQDQLDKLRAASEKLEQDKKNVLSKSAQVQKSFRDEEKAAYTESNFDFAKRQGWRGAMGAMGTWMLPINTGIGQSGYTNKQEAAAEAARAGGVAAKDDSEKQVAAIQKEITRSLEEQMKLSEDIARIDQQRLTTSKELRQSAYENVQHEQERLRGGNIEFGTASIADQNRIMRIQKKHERIEAQKAANRAAGRDENEGIERYTPMEMRTNILGNIAGKTMRDQAEKAAASKGFQQETNLPQLQEILKNELSKPLDTTKYDVNQSKNQAHEIAQIIKESIQEQGSLGEQLENIKEELRQFKEEIKLNNLKRKGWFQ